MPAKKKAIRKKAKARHVKADDQAWFWTPEWQAKEREADADLAAGRVKTFKSAAEAIAWLKS